jgi:hypothetical protein
MDRTRLLPWVVRAAWAALPFLAGPALAAALDGRAVPGRTAASVALWLVWAVALGAALVLHPVSLTVLRVVAPAAVAAAGWAVLTGDAGPVAGPVALVATATAAALAFLPETGIAFVNGPAYPNERRFPLRVPGPLLLGPLELAWLLTAGLPVAALLLLAGGRWVPGVVLAVAAGAAGWFLGRALHGLSRRWVVFVPAGLVVHDPASLVDPVLFPKAKIGAIDVAEAGTAALDLTKGALGLAVELRLREPAPLVLAEPGRRVGPTVEAAAVLFTPTRPGRVLAEARERMRGAPSFDPFDDVDGG